MRRIAIALFAGSYTLLALQASAETNFHRINFEPNSADMRPDSIAILHELAEYLNAPHDVKIDLAGNACASEERSETLWFDRALATGTFLLQHGVRPLQVISIGKTDPRWQSSMRELFKSQDCSETERTVLFNRASEEADR